MTGYDAVFVGGGVIGLSSALAACRRGLSVAVVDPAPGRGATYAAAGMLAAVTEAHFGQEQLGRLLVEGAARWDAFAAEVEEESGHGIGYVRCGTLVVAADADDRAWIDRLLAYQQSLGLDAARRSASACRRLVPALAPGVRGGAEVAGDHQVDNRLLADALVAACRSRGVTLMADRVATVVCDEGRASGVTLGSGDRVAAAAVVIAAGCDSGRLPGVPAGALPAVRPVKGHILRLRGPAEPPLLGRTVRALVHGRSVYLVPRQGGSLVVGATVEERGFDRTVQAGPVHALLSDAREVVPGLDDLELVECAAGLRPGSPDDAPVVGWTGVAGLAVATGHFRNGILLAPITASAVADLLAGADPADGPFAAFGPDRFAVTTGGRR